MSRVAQRVVGRYEILREIGQGGMATVHLARQIDLDRLVALKELRALRNDDPTLVRRFLREARLAGSLTHPNIVTVHDYFEEGGAPHIAMEYMAGGSLRPYVGRLSPAHVGRMIEGLLAGLAEAERHDIVHRDIKPENLLVTTDGGVKIADFGIAKATKVLEGSVLLTATGMTVGTPSYIAPEQAMARELGPWTDLYAVGVTTFELFAGRTPFSDTQEPMAIVLRQINEPIPPLTDFVPNADAWLTKWIQWLVAKDPALRPQSAREAWDGLEEVLIRLLGPRWRRNAQEPLAQVTPPTAQARPVADPRLAATAAPRRRRSPVTPSAPASPVRRKTRGAPNIAKVGALVAVLTAGAILFGKSGGSPSAPASENSPAVTSPATTTSTRGAQAAAASDAFGLAKTYRRAAASLAGRRGSQVTKLRSAFKRTAAAYERAGTAATSGDVGAYDAALADAAVYRQTIAAVGTSVPHGTTPVTTTITAGAAPRQVAPARIAPASSTPTMTTPARSAPTTTAPAQTAPTSGCEGDSQSDDPSDDACGP